MRVGSPVIIIHLIVMQCVKEKVEWRERGSREGEGEGEGGGSVDGGGETNNEAGFPRNARIDDYYIHNSVRG